MQIAVRALSPSLNDPYTAVNSLDQLSVALCHLAEHAFPGRYRYDEQHRLRVLATPVAFEQVLDLAFDQIRMNGNKFVMVLNKLLAVIAVVAERVQTLHACASLRQHAQLIERSSHDGIKDEHDREKVAAQWAAAMHTIRTREAVLQQEQSLPLADAARDQQLGVVPKYT